MTMMRTKKDPIRDERRWKHADANGDGLLTQQEFYHFIHPEESLVMKDLVVQETLDEIDTNKDGLIDLNEYVKDMWTPSADEKSEPDWVESERATFASTRDANKDGMLDRAEIRTWIMPDESFHIQTETQHLMTEADADKDGILTREEILDKYDVFVGSQATDYGESLHKHHEEL